MARTVPSSGGSKVTGCGNGAGLPSMSIGSTSRNAFGLLVRLRPRLALLESGAELPFVADDRRLDAATDRFDQRRRPRTL
jgi:hypothetical protein